VKLLSPAPPEALADAPPDLVAALAVRAPDAGAPDRATLHAAMTRIRNPQRSSRLLLWSGWGAAACLTGFLVLERLPAFHGTWLRPGSVALPSAASSRGEGTPTPLTSGEIAADRDTPALSERDPARRGPRLAAIRNLMVEVPNVESLQRELAALREAKQARLQASPGLSRTVVVEMTDPTDARENKRVGTLLLSDRVAESIAAGVASADEKKPDKTTEPVAQPLQISGGDSSWNGDLVIEKGLPNTGMLNLPEGTQIRHLDFPVEQAADYRGLRDLGNGYFYDQFSDVLWRPTGEGRTYLGERAPNGFDVETFVPPGPTPPAAQPVQPAQPVETPSAETEAPIVRGYPIFDETTGSGSIILQNLPEPGEGQSYQLWVNDEASAQPVSIGLIPALDAGEGRVWFDMGGPGVAPTGYLLTLEPATGSKSPTGQMILKGP
jgi:hypothetical protein